ncbi:FAD-dependent oxidoreductase [Planctomycetota bacterium]|nr:FAD-dependent oxidoreductase [Planctomycetota bacterium]
MEQLRRLDLDRYLVPFSLRQVPQYRYDVVVLGTGVAGCVTALAAARAGASVAVLAKDSVGVTNGALNESPARTQRAARALFRQPETPSAPSGTVASLM